MKTTLYTLILIFFSLPGFGQLFIDTSYTAEQMVMDFFSNSCVTPTNVSFTGGDVSLGYFEGANTDLGLDAGIVLSTGDVTTLADVSSAFSSTSYSLTGGDPDLDPLVAPYGTFDVASLEFDILVGEDSDLNFNYIFGSEEYPEYVGSAFNDVFGFFITDGGGTSNIAMIPGTSEPVAINSVNADSNASYFVDYLGANGQDIVLDGLTTALPATFTAMGDGMYHVKIALGDAGDSVFDSGVFIGVQSLCGPMLLSPPTSFGVEQDGNTVSVANESRYATSWNWDFGDGYQSDERYPDPHTYTEDGIYTITLTTENYCCSETFEYTVEIGTSSSVSEILAGSFDIQPNPVVDYLSISTELEGAWNYQVVDISGRVLMEGEGFATKVLNFSNLDAGIYIISITNGQDSFSKRLIRQ
ncbi:MAG: T9SS type A sorting domain-containing protein [Bacteroidetes bacterium]|nr:T9SS type A sorting domain-containing protein [Bacteroidota bacterium]